MRSLPAALVAASLLAALAPRAHADRGELTEASPSTLEPGELRLGLSDVSLGLFGHDLLRRFEIGSRPIGWLPAALGLPSYDVHAKFELWRDPHLQLAVAAEHMLVDLTPLIDDMAEDADASFFVTPLEGWAALRAGPLRLNGGAVYTEVRARGSSPVGPIDELHGVVGTSSLQVRGNLELRASRTVHLVLGGRYVPWQRQVGKAGGKEGVDGVGDDTEVGNETTATTDYGDVSGRAWTASAEVHFTWEHLNLRLGAEYGNYVVPIANFVAAQRGWMPVIDLYWRI